MTENKINKLARLTDLQSLRTLFSELNFNYEDKPISKDNWSENERHMFTNSRFIASKNDYMICYIRTNSNSLSAWKSLATKIIKKQHGSCMVCIHNPIGFKWVFSIISKTFSAKFIETRHVSIDIVPDCEPPKTFVDFLHKIKSSQDSASVRSQISNAFDSLAIKIHDELTINVFDALKILSEGIIDEKFNKLDLNEQTLRNIREPIFILLYRIMFVLYAEDRSIFPDDSFYYDKFSLNWIKNNWILKPTSALTEYNVYNRLKKLFRLIEMGSEKMGYNPDKFFMRSYYGRLFDRQIYNKLDKWKISNNSILKAIDLLTRTKDTAGNYFFLDYSALTTRHLGAIYEHLLEYHLTIKNGHVADLPNVQDRKKTGSYYTPQHIVDYIVENTLGPIIDNIVNNTLDTNKQIDQILELNVLDPAMGSGHFLVGATNYISQRICEIECHEEITEQALVERKRDVARRCIYGVDLNPLAVDLANVSLWLETLSSDRPLSFFSAHLKTGNSLIGASIDDIFPKQTTIIESEKGRASFKKTIKEFIMFEAQKDDTAHAVKSKIKKYKKIQSKKTVYNDLKLFLNAKIAKFFDIQIPPMGDFVSQIGENNIDFYQDHMWDDIQNTAQKNSLFHWDLEFLDIFYDSDGNRKKNKGFDVVIGNPPYLNLGARNVLKKLPDYESLSNGVLNIASLFIKKSLDLVVDGGRVGLIIPKSFLSVESWKPIRDLVLKYSLLEVNDVGRQWDDVDLEQTIIIISNTDNNTQITKTKILNNFVNISNISQQTFIDRGIILTQLNKTILSLIKKIENNSILLNCIAEMPRGTSVHSSEYESKDRIGLVRVLGGVNIEKFGIKDSNRQKSSRFLRKNHPKIIAKSHIYARRRIIYQNIASGTITATIENKNLPTDDTVNNLILNKKHYSYDDIIGILNSNLMTFYLRYAIINNSQLTVHLDQSYIGRLPIKNPNGAILKHVKKIQGAKLQINNYNKKLYKHVKTEHANMPISNKLQEWFRLDFNNFCIELTKTYGSLSPDETKLWKKYYSQYSKKILKIYQNMQMDILDMDSAVFNLYKISDSESKMIIDMLD